MVSFTIWEDRRVTDNTGTSDSCFGTVGKGGSLVLSQERNKDVRDVSREPHFGVTERVGVRLTYCCLCVEG